jgi:hypothetical protein
VATGIGGQSDVNAFKNIDMAAGFSSPLKSANMKAFEGIEVSNKQQVPQQLPDNDSENYQEVDDYKEETGSEPQYQKRPSSFFDRFRNRSSGNDSRFDDVGYQKRPTPIQMPTKQTEVQQQPQQRSVDEDDEDYDIPSCFRRKK